MKLFEPGKIGRMETKNRIVMAPMGIGALAEPDGRLSRRAIDYYEARAEGGVGLIISGITCVDVEIEKKAEQGLGVFLRADLPIHINGFSELADALHDHGAKLCVQLTAGVGRVAYGEILSKGHAVAPSPAPCFWNPKVTARELTTEEVEGIIQAFARAAVYLKIAGVDAIQLHGHEGYLLDQFQSAVWNRRTDRFGGDLEGRLRFPLEVIGAIKDAAGRDFPVIYRYGLVHHIEGGREMDESLEMARRFEEAGVDALEADAGCYETWYWAHPPTYQPPGCMVDMAETVREAVNIPVIAVGKLGYPELAERVLREGKADFICLGRPLLADPQWPIKVKEERFEDIRPCIGDHTGCLGRIFRGKYLSCTVNPATGKEREFRLSPAPRSRSVLVVGGGPGGMEAARVAALRGHRVSLWEKEQMVGGNLIPASAPRFKRDLVALEDYLAGQVRKLDIDVRLGTKADEVLVLDAAPDVVILATGSIPLIPDIPGIGGDKVMTAIDLFFGRKEAGKSVLVIGGGLVGCEAAVHLAQGGRRVTVVEMLDRICRGENRANLQQMMKMLKETGVEVLTRTEVKEINDGGAVIERNDGSERVAAESVIIAAGLVSRNDLADALRGKVPALHIIGDCVRPRRIMDAMWEGFRTARLI